MKILISLSAIIIIIFTSSCSSGKSIATSGNNSKIDTATEDSQVYFKASGNEPFWNLTISENNIKIVTVEDTIIVAHKLPVSSKNNNIKTYQVQTTEVDITIEITQTECENKTSAVKSPYAVGINYKKNGVLTTQQMEGCGKYITDYRLHDIWVLEILNGEKVHKSSFQKDLPSIEIDAAGNSFMGFGGCNRISGQIFYEKDVLNFKNAISTMMYCGENNKEREFLSALNKASKYKIENNRLVLYNDFKELITFLKVD